MSDLSLFDFNGNSVRSFVVDGTIWFVAKDVCDVLELENVGQALTRLDEDEKGSITLNDGTPGNPNTATISEQGFYSLVLSSRKPQAKPFRKWVTSEVLPAIRKTGTYSLPSAPPQRQLAPQRDLKDWIDCAKIMGVAEDPILKSLATQRLAEEMGGSRNADILQPIVLTVRAQQLGISQAEIGTGTKLGKYIVKSGFLPQGKSQHGKYEVNVYAASGELDEAILEFFDHG